MSARSFDINSTKKQGNVKVMHMQWGLGVELHGNCVVSVTNSRVQLNSCGYKTATTKVAINRALEQLGRSERVSQKAGKWFVGNVEFYDGMVI